MDEIATSARVEIGLNEKKACHGYSDRWLVWCKYQLHWAFRPVPVSLAAPPSHPASGATGCRSALPWICAGQGLGASLPRSLKLVLYTVAFGVVIQPQWQSTVSNPAQVALIYFSGLVVFDFFFDCINRAPTLMFENVSYVKKIVFPLEMLGWVVLGSAVFRLGDRTYDSWPSFNTSWLAVYRRSPFS